MDNWYNSIHLAIDLKNNKSTIVGTLRNKTSVKFPSVFWERKKGNLDEVWLRKQHVAYIICAKKNKNVLLISIMHDQGVIDPVSEERKPEVIMYYN